MFPELTKSKNKRRVKLDEDTWKKKSKKQNFETNIFNKYDALLTKYQNLPRKRKRLNNFVMLRFNELYRNVSGKRVLDSRVSYEEFKSLDGTNQLYNVVVDTFIKISIATKTHKDQSSFHCITCEEGEKFFYNSYNRIVNDIIKYEQVFIPILHKVHYTLVYLNVPEKTFYFIDPMGFEQYYNHLFEKFVNVINQSGWSLKHMEHDIQIDVYNCGVYCCQFV